MQNSFIKYWAEISQREDPAAMQAELPIMVKTIGIRELYKIVVAHFEKEASCASGN